MSEGGSNAAEFVRVQGLSHAYRQGEVHQRVLMSVGFALRAGEIVALLGRSGSGKTTLLNCLSGIEVPDSGSVSIDGADIGSLDERSRTLFRRRRIGFIYQFFNLVPSLTAQENLALMLELNGSSVQPALREALALLRSAGMEQLADKFPAHLSGGEQQRVAILRALIHQPALVLADEPTGNLDARTGDQMLAWMTARLRATRSTALLVTHSLAVARGADRILTLEDGIVQERAGDFAW